MWCNIAMSWDTKQRGGKPYFYRSIRVNGRAEKQYLGTGPAAELAAKLLDDRRRERVDLTAERMRWATALAALDDLHDCLAVLVHSELLLRGFYAHRGQWRPRGRKPRASPHSPAAA